MSHIIKKYGLLLCCLSLFIGAGNNTKRLRFHTNLSTAKQKAAIEGKLYLVDFTAKWCMPCQWMEETTFADSRVVDYMSDRYVAVQIDVDDFDGFAYKQLYKIKILPSILIFNSKGKLLEQYTGSHAPSGLLKILQEHDTPENRIRVGNTTVTPSSPTKETLTVADAKPAVTAPVSNHRPTRPRIKVPKVKKAKKAKPTVNKPKVSKPKVNRPSVSKPPATYHAPSTRISAPKVNAAPEIITDEGLFKFTVSRRSKEGFSVQIGVFAEYGNVLREVEKLEKKYQQPILVQISKLKNKPVYKVMVGEFNDRDQASLFKDVIVNSGMEGMVKDLSAI